MHKNLITKNQQTISCKTFGTKILPKEKQYFPIQPEFIFLNHVEVVNTYTHNAHKYPSYELIIPIKNQYNCKLNNKSLQLDKNEILLIQPFDLHQDTLKKGTIFYAIWFTVSKFPENEKLQQLFHQDLPTSKQVISINNQKLAPIFEMIENEGTTEEPFTGPIIKSLFNILFWNIIRHIPEKDLSSEILLHSRTMRFQNNLWNYFKKNLDKHLEIRDMAKALNMSSSSISHNCRKALGVTPAKAFMKCKIDEAERLLKTTDLTIKEISISLGFKDPFHFSKVFKRFKHTPPTLFRNETEDKFYE